MDFCEDKLISEINKSNINPNAGLSIDEQLKSAFTPIKAPTKIDNPVHTSTRPTLISTCIPESNQPRTIQLSNQILKLMHRDRSGENLEVADYCRRVIRQNENVSLGHVLAEQGKAFTQKKILMHYGESSNAVAHSMALCEVNQDFFMFTDKDILMLVGADGNSVAHLIAKSPNFERMSFVDFEIFSMKNDKGESVAKLLFEQGVKFSNKAFDNIRNEIFSIITP